MQITMFDGSKPYKITKPIRLIELFAGYGSQHLALKYLKQNAESWRICEWAVKSIQAYKDMHFKDDTTDYSKNYSCKFIIDELCSLGISADYNKPMTKDQIKRMGENKCRTVYNNIKATHNLVDISKAKAKDLEIVDTDKYEYIMTYSFPCQDLSKAGKGLGMARDSGTRSGLLWQVERLLEECKQNGSMPQVLLMENVPDVIGTQNMPHFAQWLQKLESLGYHCYYDCLNSKHYGVPQNRDRCFMVSILGDYYYNFPNKKTNDLRMQDLLENEVDKKYYLGKLALNGKLNTSFQTNKLENVIPNQEGIMPTLCARDYKDPKCVIISKTNDDYVEIKGKKYPITKNNDNYIQWKQAGFLDSDCRAWKIDRISGTLTTNGKLKILKDIFIRKCLPVEYFRLMGVKDEDFEKVAENQSNASLYHLAGDSIVVDVLMQIFQKLL